MKHIFEPLVRNNISVTVVAHFNHIQNIKGQYSKEARIDFNKDNIISLNPDILWVERQNDYQISSEMDDLHGISWHIDNPLFSGLKKNLLHQLHSLSRILEMIRFSKLESEKVFAILRADMQYLDDLDVNKIHDSITQQKVDMITPGWDKWGGLNDRFAFLSPRAIEPVLNRRNLVLDYAQQYGNMHSEGLLLFAANKYGLQLDETPMRAERVRGNGRVNFEPFEGV